MEYNEFPSITYLSMPLTDVLTRYESYNTDGRHANSESSCSR